MKMIGRLSQCEMNLWTMESALWNPDEDSIAQCVEFGKQMQLRQVRETPPV